MHTQVFGLVEELFELDPGSVAGDEPLTGLPGWSSLTFVALIATVDEEFGVTLAPQAILACGSVDDLATLVEREVRQAKRRAA